MPKPHLRHGPCGGCRERVAVFAPFHRSRADRAERLGSEAARQDTKAKKARQIRIERRGRQPRPVWQPLKWDDGQDVPRDEPSQTSFACIFAKSHPFQTTSPFHKIPLFSFQLSAPRFGYSQLQTANAALVTTGKLSVFHRRERATLANELASPLWPVFVHVPGFKAAPLRGGTGRQGCDEGGEVA